ncbi:magnesium transporter [Shewanella gelidii]|uniref:Magnesium transporter n=1 Tax=Shewanella gelidii TaxID=1642821 RepID=A0A917JTD7_9GAMM|nr:magnesium transporter [Shewanella gelidii]MCL1098681.1 magnesium transporter [Shewanella gelidii]GGI86126.1 hypothetical protein GCM10009332_24290 [Shewanella gelidii]
MFKATLSKVRIITLIFIKFIAFMAVMITGAYFLAPLGLINSKDIEMSQFSNTPSDTMMAFFNSEIFSGYLFMVTITLAVFAIYLLWQLHEVAVHQAQAKKSAHVQLVFALSLCGLFLHKAWWVGAIIIAFANWQHIGQSITQMLRNSRSEINAEIVNASSHKASAAGALSPQTNKQPTVTSQG